MSMLALRRGYETAHGHALSFGVGAMYIVFGGEAKTMYIVFWGEAKAVKHLHAFMF